MGILCHMSPLQPSLVGYTALDLSMRSEDSSIDLAVNILTVCVLKPLKCFEVCFSPQLPSMEAPNSCQAALSYRSL